MWSWLQEGGGYSSGAAYPLVGIMVLLAASALLFSGLVLLKTRIARIPVGTREVTVSGGSALVLGWLLCAAGVGAFASLVMLLF